VNRTRPASTGRVAVFQHYLHYFGRHFPACTALR
jgi:hypothetical protein